MRASLGAADVSGPVRIRRARAFQRAPIAESVSFS